MPILNHALASGMQVEVYSNLVSIKPDIWDALSQERVSLATSYYSSNPAEHRAITQRNTAKPIRKNIQEALRRGIPLRVGIVGVLPDQNIEGAKAELIEMGIDPERIGVDYMRQVGRGVRDQEPSTEELCGNCANGVIAVGPDGGVHPCVFTRWDDMQVGNVLDAPLGEIFAGERFGKVHNGLIEIFTNSSFPCRPQCGPNCPPSTGCGPCNPDRKPCFPLTKPPPKPDPPKPPTPPRR